MFLVFVICGLILLGLFAKACELTANKIQEIRERPARAEYTALEKQYGYYGAQDRCPHKLTKPTHIRLALFNLPATYCKTCHKILPKGNSK